MIHWTTVDQFLQIAAKVLSHRRSLPLAGNRGPVPMPGIDPDLRREDEGERAQPNERQVHAAVSSAYVESSSVCVRILVGVKTGGENARKSCRPSCGLRA